MADSVISYEDLIGKDDTFDVLFENIEQLKGELIELAQMQKNELGLVNPNDEEAVRKAAKEVGNLTRAMKKLDTQEKKTQKTKKKSNDLTNEELIAKEKQKIVNRERLLVAKQMAILTSKESGEIERLRARLSLTTLEWKKLTKEELDNTKKGRNLIKSKKDLTNQLKKLEKQTGDTRRNVGNYTASLGKMGKMAAGIFVGRNIASAVRNIGVALGRLIEKNKDSSASAKSLSESLAQVGTILEKLGLFVIDVIAGPLKALISGFQTFSKVVLGIDISTKKASEGVRDLQMEFNAEMEALERGNLSAEARKQLIEEINKKYKKYIPNLLTIKSTQEDITAAKEAGNRAFEKEILQMASQELHLDIYKRRIDALGEEVRLEGQLNKARITAAAFATEESRALARAAGEGRTAELQSESALKKMEQRVAMNRVIIDGINEEKKALDELMDAEGFKFKIPGAKDPGAGAGAGAKAAAAIYKDNAAQRIAAIEALQAQIRKLDAENEEDKTERLLALEEFKFQTLQIKREKDFEKFKQLLRDQADNELAFHGAGSAELIAFQKFAGEEILRVEAINKDLSKAQLKESEKKKEEILKKSYKAQLKIIKDGEAKKLAEEQKNIKIQRDFQIKLTDLKLQNIEDDDKREIAMQKEKFKRMRDNVTANNDLTIYQQKQLIAEIDKLEANADKERKSKESEGDQKTKEERTKELMVGIQKTAEKVGAAIVDTFNKQAAGAASLVEKQSEAVESQRERAEKGLSNTLKFEQEQLAQREAERIRADKKAKHAAELVALFNLVSAYAASGDSNAMARGLVDWSLLKALSEGFEEGGWTGDYGTKQVAGVVHGQEYVVTSEDAKRYGLTGRAGGDFGEAMSDYFYSPLQRNMYLDQQGRFNEGLSGTANTFVRLENEVRAMRRAFEDMPKNDFDILQMTDYFVEISKRVTSNRMTNVSKQRKRL